MSMNKFMHPRNIYRTPPNFKELAIKYPEFRKYATTDLSGKVVIDFKDQGAVRALTCTLLEKDFGLTVEMPLNRLVPTLPLRLNYLLWIEDLLIIANPKDNIKGIDIGTGASCIYSLLGAKTKGWKMLGTEMDSESIEYANRNIEKNCLEKLISVKQVNDSQLLQGVIGDDDTFHFVMCNPPFFSHEGELDCAAKSRSPARTPPSNGPTGSIGEVVVQGGEVAFVKRIIAESKEIGQRIKLFSSMVGHKRNVSLLLEETAKAGVTSSCRTEFCQGNTTRWGVAWTFCTDIRLPSPCTQLVPNKKLQLPMSYTVPSTLPGIVYTVQGVITRVRELLEQMQMEVKTIKETKYLTAVRATAWNNTWSNQRRKRRREEAEPCNKKPKLEPEPFQSKPHEGPCLLETQLVVRSVDSDIFLELTWTGGTSGRDVLHQVLQFLKNQLNKC